MYKTHFLSCLALTLAFIADGAPTSGSSKDTRQCLGDVMEDLRKLLREVKNDKTPELSMVFTFKFYTPREVTDLKQLLCLKEELKSLTDVLNVTQRKNSHLRGMEESVNNINVIVDKLTHPSAGAHCERKSSAVLRHRVELGSVKEPKTEFNCSFDEEMLTIIEFLNKWIALCQSIFSMLP
ncbi:interleukin-2 [Pteronotus mesoamericanus]|uniref:interleukin-2 n=1 Tax=Pteronotus mesoamericanus TaxID=1884717 RepID=UPI0023EAB669|nr:interleukin-2 [Pteronotus parnellii mesoamericanus]